MRAQIVMATHNPHPDLLLRQINSLRAQSVQDWQCLVFDDASVDRAVVARALGDDPRFCLLPSRPHLGSYLAFQHLLYGATEDVPVFLCDQDDSWHLEKLERMLTVDRTAFSAMRVFDESGVKLRQRFLPRPPGTHALTPAGLLLMNSASGAAMMVSPSVRKAALPFPAPHLRGWHDQWLAAVAARIDALAYVDDPLVDYTRHAGQVVGDGLRSLSASRLSAYGRRLLDSGLRNDLRSRTRWVIAAASRLLEFSGPRDKELEDLAAGRFTKPLVTGLRSRNVPVARAMLLAAGRV